MLRPLALALALTAVPASAQVSFSPTVGYDQRGNAPTIGLAFDVAAPVYGLPVQPSVRPLVEYVFGPNDLDVVHANLDLIARVRASPYATAAPYVKGGLALTYVAEEGFEDETDVAFSLGAGLEVSRLFAEGEYAFGDYDGARLRLGVRF